MAGNNICVIPARGGSKRIINKNIKDFCGKPMIAHSITMAKRTGLFKDIIVSTDSNAIAKLSKDYGANVPFIRPAKLGNDFVSTGAVMAHAARWLCDNLKELSSVCCVYATAPLINEDDLIRAYKIFKNNNWDYVFSASLFDYPIQRAFMKLEKGGIQMFSPHYFETRSQDLPEAYHDAGQFYWGKTDAWLKNSMSFSINSTVVEIPSYRVLDIDTIEDWKRAELMYNILITNGEI